MSELDLASSGDPEVLTGRLTEYGELVEVLEERLGLVVVSADPLSGATDLLRTALEWVDDLHVSVDARACAGSMDLAMAIADAVVSKLIPGAASWWTSSKPASRAVGMNLAHALSNMGVDAEGLREGAGSGLRRLPEAIEMLVLLAEGDVILAIDHLDLLLATLPAKEGRELLGELRASLQRHTRLDLVLVEHRDGPIGKAMADPDHPLFHAGELVTVPRPTPARFVADLASTGRKLDPRVGAIVAAAAELTRGVPALTWKIVELAPGEGEDAPTAASAGWMRLRRLTEGETIRQWDLMRRVHPSAQDVVAALSVGLRPHAVEANPKTVNDALTRLRELGAAWQPAERRWSLSDPLLAAWVRDHAPPWTARRDPGWDAN